MNEDHSFRLALLPWAVSLMLIAAYHALRAHTGEKLDRRQEGIFILVTLRLAGVGLMLGMIACLVNPAWMAWATVTLPDWLRWAGAVIGLAAAVLLGWTLHHLGRNLSLLFLFMVIRTRKEEANLLARFGDDYRKHMGRTGRSIPRWPCDWVAC